MNMLIENTPTNNSLHSAISRTSCEADPTNGQCNLTINVHTEIEVDVSRSGYCSGKIEGVTKENNKNKEASKISTKKNRDKDLTENNFKPLQIKVPADDDTRKTFHDLAEAVRSKSVSREMINYFLSKVKKGEFDIDKIREPYIKNESHHQVSALKTIVRFLLKIFQLITKGKKK